MAGTKRTKRRGEYNDRGKFKITEFKNPSGDAYRVGGFMPDGSRVRKNFKTHSDALAHLLKLETECANIQIAGQTVFTRLTQEQVTDAEFAYSLIGNRSLKFVAQYFVDHYREPVKRKTISEAFEQFKKAKLKEGCRKGTMRNFVTGHFKTSHDGSNQNRPL